MRRNLGTHGSARCVHSDVVLALEQFWDRDRLLEYQRAVYCNGPEHHILDGRDETVLPVLVAGVVFVQDAEAIARVKFSRGRDTRQVFCSMDSQRGASAPSCHHVRVATAAFGAALSDPAVLLGLPYPWNAEQDDAAWEFLAILPRSGEKSFDSRPLVDFLNQAGDVRLRLRGRERVTIGPVRPPPSASTIVPSWLPGPRCPKCNCEESWSGGATQAVMPVWTGLPLSAVGMQWCDLVCSCSFAFPVSSGFLRVGNFCWELATLYDLYMELLDNGQSFREYASRLNKWSEALQGKLS